MRVLSSQALFSEIHLVIFVSSSNESPLIALLRALVIPPYPRRFLFYF